MSLDFLKYFDYLSSEVKLTIHNGDTRLKTCLGGFLSILSIFITVAFGLYFFIQLLSKEFSYVVGSTNITPFLNLTASNEFPFLVRLTNDLSAPFEHPDKIYSISLDYWYVESSQKQLEISYRIQLERCDINKHFGSFKFLFENLTDLHTFQCALIRPSNFTIQGRYKDVHPFGFYHFYISMCLNSPNCYSQEMIENITETIYLDFRTVDFSIDSSLTEAKVETVHSSRHMLSSTIYKRIWLLYSGVEYTTDSGFFFPSIRKEMFSKLESTRYESDNRNIYKGSMPGSFASLTLVTSGINQEYFREYPKIQTFLASIGGIVNFIQLVAFILNYIFSQNSYYFKLINDLVSNSLFKKELFIEMPHNAGGRANVSHVSILMNKISKNNTNIPRNEMNDSQCPAVVPLPIKVYHQTLLNKMKKWQYKVIPLKLSFHNQSKLFLQIVQKINTFTNITTLLIKIEEAYSFTRKAMGNDCTKMNLSKNISSSEIKLHYSENRVTNHLNIPNKKSYSSIQCSMLEGINDHK